MRESDQVKSLCPCPACGFLVHEKPALWMICPLCNWEDDEVQLRHPTLRGGANSRSLVEWQQDTVEKWPLDVQTIDGFEREPQWRPWNPGLDVAEKGPTSGMEYFEAAASYTELRYYWRDC